jgi:protoporphyrinogen oxidase
LSLCDFAPFKNKNMISRKKFIARTLAGLGAFFGFSWGVKEIFLPENTSAIKGKIVGANHAIGHLLRDSSTPKTPSEENLSVPILIIGSGISGLSAARKLYRSGQKDFLIVDLEGHFGGNATSGKSTVSEYPWASHYLPIANNDNADLLDFLSENQIITGYNEQGLPQYNEYYLCQSPQERLFINGRWQEGLVPNYGISDRDRQQLSAFFQLIQYYRQLKGSDNLWAFTIPMASASKDSVFRELDQISMTDFLNQKQFDSEYLHWYVNYCCRDDYGTTSQQTSAYAGIHYFAARKAKAANAESNALLTWPEGNHFLARALAKNIETKIRTKILVQQIQLSDNEVKINAFDWGENAALHINAQKVILATPHFVNQRLLPEYLSAQNQFHYAPWMVANITVNQAPTTSSSALCWDNVAYRSPSLGYISASHQQVSRHKDQWVLTYYLPLSDKPPAQARKEALRKSHADWVKEILEDLESFHPNIKETIEEIDVKVWGHGMIAPVVGFLSSNERLKAGKSIDNKLFFAHTDLSGISIFEEAFYQGNRVAEEVLRS